MLATIFDNPQLATNEVGAEEADGLEIDGIELQGPGATHFTIGGDGDSDGESPTNNNGHENHSDDEADRREGDGNGAQQTDGVVYSLASFEPQRHSDII